ncbi:beta 1-4 rhamnosyltransferase Cps2T [Streptococcus sciuri]|uniref:DUF1972 domain-containing protein n=1 Tax=Streptococcus sciuri TaxID=2973939 RepID=A0ABT2F6M7_9STRE|nr:DUF1972 domain-containing protein [Streptococcus sciuri]MCS4488047.1 DUF1972 domain-containing protein [Streptococcus sciuri]
MQHVFIIGSRGLPASYGGFETFVSELVTHQKNRYIKYHVACLSQEQHGTHYDYKGADCFRIKVPNLGSARVILYDMMAINYALAFIKKNAIKEPVFYILGNTIGAFIVPFISRIHKCGGKVLVNPDGLEWRRSKWSHSIQAYLKYAEKKMAQKADLIVADNRGIESYIKSSYPNAKTTFIAYGTNVSPSYLTKDSDEVRTFFQRWAISEDNYYLVVGRFVPENNYETIIREFMTTKTKRDLLIICNHEGNAYFEELRRKTGFDKDKRIKFVGTVYNRELLTYIREYAFAYIHGHEVGGTNPGLLEALSQTKLNLVLGVDFNRSVAKDSSLYWEKQTGDLAELITKAERMPNQVDYSNRAKEIIINNYTWEKIVGEYEDLFLHES